MSNGKKSNKTNPNSKRSYQPLPHEMDIAADIFNNRVTENKTHSLEIKREEKERGKK